MIIFKKIFSVITQTKEMNIYKLFFLSALFQFLFSNSFSQNSREESNIIRLHKIKEKKIYCFLFDTSEKDSVNYLISSVNYNNAGLPEIQTGYSRDGNTTGKFVSTYNSDSLEIKRTSYNQEKKIYEELIYTYNSKGNLTNRKSIDKAKGTSHEQYFEFDSIKHISKDYNVDEGEKVLTGIHEYDENRKKIKDIYYKPTGEIYTTFLTEYDSLQHSVKSFSLKSGNKVLRTEKIYNTENLIISEINYYTNTLKFRDSNGLVEDYKKGDKKEIKYSYNNNGLLQEETRTLNNRLIVKLTYEYN